MSAEQPDFLRVTDLWDEDVERVTEGEVFTHDGRAVSLRGLIQRRWGWPKKAANLAAGYMLRRAKASGQPAELWLRRLRRTAQALELISELPELLELILNGLAQDAQRESRDAERPLSEITIRLNAEIDDDGLSRGVLRAIAARLGCTMEELRDSTRFTTTQDGLVLDVQADRFAPNS